MSDALWETSDGTWTVASYVVRSLCTTSEVTPGELYFVLTSLGIEDRFRDHWDDHLFFKRAGISAEASRAVDRKCDGWIAMTGDHAWAAGDIAEAQRRYQESIDSRDSSVLVGVGGLLRLHFVQGEHQSCIGLFRRTCPPHEYYDEHKRLMAAQITELRSGERSTNWNKAFRRLARRFRGTSSSFISTAKYMCRAIVAAAVRADGIDTELRQMICDYFEMDAAQVDELAQALRGSDGEIKRLRKQLAPKPAKAGRTLEHLRLEGDTALARRLCKCIPRSANYVKSVVILLESYLGSGNSELLEEMVTAGTPFGIADADGLILSEALESRNERIATLPKCRLELMRRFNSICYMGGYPTCDFLADYMEVMQVIRAPTEPGDIIAIILDLQWYKTRYTIDHTGIDGLSGGLGKTEISKHREWLEIVLINHPIVTHHNHWSNRDDAIAALHEAYVFLRDRFKEVRRDERWISESQLGDALATLFGKKELERHARPLWLSPQHLDFYLHRYRLAVEYMGAQHYQPVDLFGGEKALKETQKRDDRKRKLCEQMGITLAYVTHEENIGQRAREIFAEFEAGAMETDDGATDIT